MPMVSLYFWDPVCVLFLFWTDGHFQTFYSRITYPT